jgi:hypothetical protein
MHRCIRGACEGRLLHTHRCRRGLLPLQQRWSRERWQPRSPAGIGRGALSTSLAVTPEGRPAILTTLAERRGQRGVFRGALEETRALLETALSCMVAAGGEKEVIAEESKPPESPATKSPPPTPPILTLLSPHCLLPLPAPSPCACPYFPSPHDMVQWTSPDIVRGGSIKRLQKHTHI